MAPVNQGSKAGLITALIITVILFMVSPKGLFPTDDTGQLLGTTEAAEGEEWTAAKAVHEVTPTRKRWIPPRRA